MHDTGEVPRPDETTQEDASAYGRAAAFPPDGSGESPEGEAADPLVPPEDAEGPIPNDYERL